MVASEVNRKKLISANKASQEHKDGLNATEADRKKDGAASQLPDEEYRYYFNTMPVGVCITNVQGEVLQANKTLLDYLGYSWEEFSANNITDTYADYSERQRLLLLLEENKRVRDFDARFKRRDGSVFPALINSELIVMEGETAIFTSIHDISRFKQTQDELMEAEAQYHLFFSNAPVGLTVTDKEGCLYAFNQAMLDLLGYTQEEMAEKNAGGFFIEAADGERLLLLTERALVVRDFETRFKRKNGGIISVLINTDLLELKNKKKVFLNSIRDISKHKMAEEELTRERDFTSAILDVATSLIMVVDKDGLITRFNRACEVTSGYTFREVVGRHPWDFLSTDPEHCKKMLEMPAESYPNSHEKTWLTKGGDRRLIFWSNTVLLDQKGKIQFMIATGIDITEQREAEIKLQEANLRLTDGIRQLEERTAEMSRLSDMGDQLQSCQSMEEACAISAQYIQMICPGTSGALFLIRSSKDLAERVQVWGDDVYTEEIFYPLDCWAIRRGHSHLVDGSHPGLICKHINGPATGQYLCVPMLAHGELMGILHLSYKTEDEKAKKAPGVFSEHRVKTVMAMAEHIALALSNLKLRETLRQQSIRDTLTGIYNRRYMEDSLVRELYRAEREKRSVGVIMFDIDHFKDFNDFYGHDGGDTLLRGLGDYLLKSTRGEDIVCRYGGEEFVAVLPGASLEDTRIRAEQLRLGVKDLRVYHMGRPLSSCTISLGVAAYPKHGLNGDELLRKADKALYRAKNSGRDQVVVCNDD